MRDPLVNRPRGAIGEYRRDGLESAGITQPSENERDIAAQMPVVMRQPRLEVSDDTAIVGGGQPLADLELSPKQLLTLEQIEQVLDRMRLHLFVGCDDTQPAVSDSRNPLLRVAIAIAPAAVWRLRIDPAQGQRHLLLHFPASAIVFGLRLVGE